MKDEFFTWAQLPQSEAEFEQLMLAVDATLTARGKKPYQRPLLAGRLFWEAFKWSGNALPAKELADRPGYTGDVLMAKAYRWYEGTYGEQLNMPGSIGHFPVQLGNAVWRARVPVIFGRVSFYIDRNLESADSNIGLKGRPATVNTLRMVDKLPQGMAHRLTDAQLFEFFSLYQFAIKALMWRDAAPRSTLLDMALADHEASTEDVLGGRFGQARWGAQQAVEKTFKGFLELADQAYPTGGPNGHNLRHLAGLMKAVFEADVPQGLLSMAECSPAVRYGEKPSTQVEALQANQAVLGVLDVLSRCRLLNEFLAKRPGAHV